MSTMNFWRGDHPAMFRHLKDRIKQADAHSLELQGKIRDLLVQQEKMREVLTQNQTANEACRLRIAVLENEAVQEREAASEREATLKHEVEALKGTLEHTKQEAREAHMAIQGQLDLEKSLGAMAREEAERNKRELERVEHSLRFEGGMRMERERDVKDCEQKVVEGQVSNGLLQQRLGEANARYEREKETVKALEAKLRLQGRESERDLAARASAASAEVEALKVQLRAANELAEARRERSSHDESVAVGCREELAVCRAAKAQLEEQLALTKNAADKEKLALDEKLAAAVQARRVTEASEHATAFQLAAAEEREASLREAVRCRETAGEDLERRLAVAHALAEEQRQGKSEAEEISEQYRHRLDTLIQTTARAIEEPLSPSALGTLKSPASNSSIASLRSPLTPASATSRPLTPAQKSAPVAASQPSQSPQPPPAPESSGLSARQIFGVASALVGMGKCFNLLMYFLNKIYICKRQLFAYSFSPLSCSGHGYQQVSGALSIIGRIFLKISRLL